MGLFNLFSGQSKQQRRRRRTRDAATVAQEVLTRYHQRRQKGAMRVDDEMYLEVAQLMRS